MTNKRLWVGRIISTLPVLFLLFDSVIKVMQIAPVRESGPFTEAKEVVGGYAVYEVKSKQEAVEWTSRFMQLHREHWKGWEGGSEVRQIFDPSAFGPEVAKR